MLGQQPGRLECDRDVGVVAASMHHPGRRVVGQRPLGGRGVVGAGVLLDRQPVDVGPVGDDRSVTVFHGGHDSGPAADEGVVAVALHEGPDRGGGGVLPHRELGGPVKVLVELDGGVEVGVEVLQQYLIDGHDVLS